MLICQIYKIPL